MQTNTTDTFTLAEPVASDHHGGWFEQLDLHPKVHSGYQTFTFVLTTETQKYKLSRES